MRFVEFRPSAGDASAPLRLSMIGFGCSAMLGRASRKESLSALGAAVDRGVNFFDTARSYGYGGSEGLLGEFLRSSVLVRRDEVVVCTKFGILPARQGWKQRVKPLARAAVRAFPGLRKAAQRQAATQFVSGQFTVETLRASFETSLRELRTDYVDILLMHAAPESVLAADDLLEALERLVESGKVRVAGISADLPVIARTFAERPRALRSAQFALNASLMGFVEQTRSHADMLLVANHPFGGPGGRAAAHIAALRSAENLPHALREKLVEDDPQLMPEVVLNCILDGTGVSAVIPAMMQLQHIESNIRAVEQCRFSSHEIALLRQGLAAASA